ncbi:MAG: condensation domain-containing protein, partial [Verrucomicrobia bacterium]|nr:condensation domain-containing protein [Verrucomicrobiota bacterium]
MNDQAQIMAENLLQLQKLSNLTRRQLLIWLGQQGHLSTPKYSIPFLWTFEQDLDPGILQAAFQQVVDDHETLRTVIQLESGIPKARIMSEMKVLMDVVDLSSHTDPEPALREWIQQRIGRGFQLEHCLFDTALVKLQNHCAWYLNEHHLITDGRSKQLVFQNTADEFAQLSGEAVAGQGDPVQFSEYIEFERKSLEKRSANRARQYWSDFLTSNPACEVFPTPSNHLTPGVRISRELDASYTRRIRANGSAPEGNLTFVSTLVTALLTLLYR